ncbi:MAG: transglutaminase family protein, partial [Bryobacteraceae bacterium]
MKEILDLLAGQGRVELDRAALLLATIEYPNLNIDGFLSLLDSHASELHRRLDGVEGLAFVHEANRYLFEELGFRGNTDDYYNPANSCLNDVLTARLGIPITLSVVYIEIARRLGRPVFGVGLPGHFVVRYDDGREAVY